MIVYHHLFLSPSSSPSAPPSTSSTTTPSAPYDWIFISGDDTYVLVDSLRMFLQSTAVQQAQQRGEKLFMGGTWMWNRGLIYNHGGGRTLNKHNPNPCLTRA